jgi:DNA-binding transcriptional ArsR family regulator
MVEYKRKRLDHVLAAIANPTRRKVLDHLAKKPQSVGALNQKFESSLAAISKHIQILEHAGLIFKVVEGRMHVCHANVEAMGEVIRWFSQYQTAEPQFDVREKKVLNGKRSGVDL